MGESLHVCCYERCGRTFETPVRLTDLSRRPRLETYYACPYCFSKVNEADEAGEISHEMHHLHAGGYEISAGGKKSLKAGTQKGSERAVDCPHHLGYLKKRPKDEAVPDGCLTCPKILQCMVSC